MFAMLKIYMPRVVNSRLFCTVLLLPAVPQGLKRGTFALEARGSEHSSVGWSRSSCSMAGTTVV